MDDWIRNVICVSLMLSMLGKYFIRRHFEIFFSYFSQKIGFDISCKLSKEKGNFLGSSIRKLLNLYTEWY